MDLHVGSSTYGISVDRNAEVRLDGHSGIEHSQTVAENSSNSTSYWQLYKEKYHRLGITEKQTANDTSKITHGTPGGTPAETSLDNSVGSSCRTGKSRHRGSDATGLASRCHRTYSERNTRVSTMQLLRPNSHPNNSIVDCHDVTLDMLPAATPLASHSFSTADFRNCQNSQENTDEDGERPVMTATPRTSSLLNDPTLRKHLARAMGVNPSSDALEVEINRRVGSVHVPSTFIKRTSSCRSAMRQNNNNKDDCVGKLDVESFIKTYGMNQESAREPKGKPEQTMAREPDERIKSDSGYGVETSDMSRCLSEGSRILLSGKRTKSERTQRIQRTGASQVERLRAKDVTYQSPEVSSGSTVSVSEKHVASPSLEEAETNMSHLWNSTAKDTKRHSADEVKPLDRQGNRTESTDPKISTSVLPVSPAIARRPPLPRRTYSMNVPQTTMDSEVHVGFHMPSFKEYKELKKQNSTTSDNALSEEELPPPGVSTKMPKSSTTECKNSSSDAISKPQECVKQPVGLEVKQPAADTAVMQETECVPKPRRKKTPAKTKDEPTSAQKSKQLMLCKQKTTIICDEAPTTQSPAGKSDTKSVCVVSPVSVPSEQSDSGKAARGIQKQQTMGELGSLELDLPVVPPRRNRKLKVQLKLPLEVIPDSVGEADTGCVDCIVARKTSKSSRRDETFRSSQCRLHRSKLSRQESDANDWTLTEEGEESPLWHSLSVSTSNETLSSQQTAVVRSVSDVSDLNGEEKRRKPVRRRRSKPYKSDPFDNITKLEGDKTSNQVAPGQTQRQAEPETRNVLLEDDILEFLRRRAAGAYDGIKENDEVGELGQTAIHRKRHKVRRSLERSCSKKEEDGCGARVKRTDSGVCCEAYERLRESKETGPTCEDCGKVLEDSDIPEGLQWEEVFICRKCKSRCVERKETIQEIVDTEISYGKDLRIIKGEFYEPMKTASLLNADQLQTIFSNLDQLIEVNNRFADILQDALELANEQGDEDYTTVSIGQLFLDSSTMLLAYETYCVNQSGVAPYLEQLESNKELLRVFLSVSQTENSVLRRMSFKSFLMVPVQRIMRYPLLLERVYKATPVHHHDRDYIKKAEEKIEAILNHINRKSKSPITSTLLRMSKRRFGGPPPGCRSIASSSAENIEVNKVTVDILPWDRNEINFVLTGRMLYCQQQEQLWGKKGRTLKLLPIYCVLVTLGKGKRVNPVTPTDDGGMVPNRPHLQHAALVLVKEKWFKCTPLRDPIYLDKCVVSLDDEFRLIEVLDIASNESYAIKGENQEATVKWYEHLKQYSTTLGMWRSRRNALPNIMVKDLSKFHELAAADLYD